MKKDVKKPVKSQQGQFVKPTHQSYNSYKGVKKGQSGCVSGRK